MCSLWNIYIYMHNNMKYKKGLVHLLFLKLITMNFGDFKLINQHCRSWQSCTDVQASLGKFPITNCSIRNLITSDIKCLLRLSFKKNISLILFMIHEIENLWPLCCDSVNKTRLKTFDHFRAAMIYI